MLGTSKSISGFDPRTVPGCQLWLDGADQSSMTLSGSNVTQWNDKSGNGYVMTNNQGTTTVATASLNSLTTVYTPSGTNTRITNFVGRTKCTIFLVGKAAISRYLLSLNGGFLYTANDSLLYFSPPTGNYLDLVDSVSGSIVSNNTWFILCIGYDNATNSTANPYTINGTTRSTTITPRGTPGILTDQNITSTLYINSTNGTNSYDSVYTAEILYYNDTLTTSQRQQVEGYLAHKWGLTGYYDSSTPLSIPGCALWLDVIDSSTTVSSGSVTSITNKSTNTIATVSSTLPTYSSSLINGLPGINFTGSSFIRGNFSSAYTGSNMIVFAVGSLSSTITTAYARLVSFSVPGSFDYNSVERVSAINRQLQIEGITSYRNAELGGTPMVYNTNYLFCTEFTGTTYNFYLNGSKTSTTSSSGSFNISAWGVGYLADYGGSDDPGYWKGSFGECVAYLGSLTTTQRETIERYLMKKWRIGSNPMIPSTHPFSSVRPHLRPFQPIDVPGCALWLDAADTNSLTLSGSTVTQWSDKSGTGNNATANTGTVTTNSTKINGLNTIRFNTSSFLNIASFTMTSNVSMFAVIRGVSAQGSGNAGYFLLGGGAQPSFFLYTLQPQYGNISGPYLALYGSGTETNWYMPSTDYFLNNPGLIYIDTTASYINGSQLTLNPYRASVPNTINAGTYSIQVGGRIPADSLAFDFAECIFYNRTITTSERQQVEGYLAHKWGLTPSLPVISPLSIPGCQLWLDGADQSSMTLSGSSITQLRDKSGNGNHMVNNGTSPLYNSSLINSVGGIDCTNGGALISSGIQNSANISFAMVAVVKSGIRNWGSFFTHGDRDYDFAVERQENTSSINFQTANDNSSCIITFTVDAPVLYFGTMTSGTTRFFESFSGGVNTIVNGTNPSTISLGSKIIRVGKSDNNNEPCNSFIGEIIYYTTVLTTTQRQQIEGYLARKWGISIGTTLPSPHPFRSFPPASLPFSPRNISGLQLWLDADDPSNFTGSTWNDKSGTNNHAVNGTPGTTSMPTVTTWSNGRRAARFVKESKNSIKTTNSIPIYVTYFIVARIQDVTGATGIGFLMINNVDGQRQVRTNSTSFPVSVFFFTQTGGTNMVFGSFSQGQGFLFSGTVTSGSAIAYGNGVQSGTSGVNNSSPSRHYFGSGDGDNDYLSVDFAEMLIYDSVLTTAQRQQVEGYLAHKWGLVPPSSTTPLSVPGCALWLDGADTTSFTLSGSNVTQWRDKSGNENNATPYSTSPQRIGNSVLFSGSNALKCGKFLTSTSYSVFIVNNFASGFTNKISFGCWKVEYGSFTFIEDGVIRVGVNNSGNYNVDASTSTASYTSNHIYGLTLSSSSTPGSAFTFNGSIDGSNVLVSGTSTSGNATTCAEEVTIGGLMEDGIPKYQLNGYVYEVLVYNSALTTTQRQTIEAYLAKKWGIGASSIPSTHPYSKLPPA